MKILITNDDGIHAPGLPALVRWAQKLGEVTVLAPKTEQSAKSHGINIHTAFEVRPVELFPGVRAYSVDSTPADCVRFAVLGMKERFDLVLSGINRGLNIGSDIMYSGTVAAVFEAAALGMAGIALSTPPEYYDRAAAHLDEVADFFRTHALLEKCRIYNVNIPASHNGFRITRQGGAYYSDDFLPCPDHMQHPQGRDVFRPCGSFEPDTDAVLVGHYISVMPLTADRTDLEVYRALRVKNGENN